MPTPRFLAATLVAAVALTSATPATAALAVDREQVADINTTGDSGPEELVRLGEVVVFSADDGTAGRELWITDGTDAGTEMLADINPAGDSTPNQMTKLGDLVLFAADDGTHGEELWATDGTAAGTEMIADIAPSGGADPRELFVLGDRLLFSADDGTDGDELWISDGTAAGTARIADINSGADSSQPHEFVALDGAAYFAADDGTSGEELWRTDGTDAGTWRVRDIFPGANEGAPTDFAIFGNRIFFRAESPAGAELWTSDGTLLGTRILRDIDPGPDSSMPGDLVATDDALYFRASDGTHGAELWVSDGTPAGTVMVEDIAAGGDGSGPEGITAIDGELWFAADDTTHGTELWRSDGTSEGTSLVFDAGEGFDGDPFAMTDFGDLVVFTAKIHSASAGAYATDGTDTWRLDDEDIAFVMPPNGYTLVGPRLFHAAQSTADGVELWALDGTPEPPADVAVSGAASSTLTVSWSAPSNTGAAALSGFVATASPGGATCAAGADERTCTLEALEPGTEYAVTVTAENELATSDPSAAASGTTTAGLTAADPCAGSPTHPFTDVDPGSFAADDIGCIYVLGITTGTSATTYSPAADVTREQMAAFLARTYRTVTGEECSGTHPFTDVDPGSFAAGDIGCISTLGITTGTSATTYSPAADVTREQMAAFLARTHEAITAADCATPPHGFTDVPDSSFAADAVACIKALGITTGTSATTYSPGEDVSREQMAAFLARTHRSVTSQGTP